MKIESERVSGRPARGGARFPLVLRASPYLARQEQSCRARGLDWPAFRPLCRDFESLILHYPRKVGGAPVAIPCNASP